MIRSSIHVFMVALLVVVPWATSNAENFTEGQYGGLLHRIETDHYQYVLGAWVDISYTVTNVTEGPVYILLSQVGCPLRILVYEPQPDDPIWIRPSGCFDEEGWATLLPGEFFSLEDTWDMTNAYTGEPIDETGVYTLRGLLSTFDPGTQYSIDLQIEVLPPTTGASGSLDDPTTWSVLKALYR